jgi:hypothetical protein
MKTGITLFLSGLILFLIGILFTSHWRTGGAAIGIIGSMVMGSGIYFLVKEAKNQKNT